MVLRRDDGGITSVIAQAVARRAVRDATPHKRWPTPIERRDDGINLVRLAGTQAPMSYILEYDDGGVRGTD